MGARLYDAFKSVSSASTHAGPTHVEPAGCMPCVEALCPACPPAPSVRTALVLCSASSLRPELDLPGAPACQEGPLSLG